MKTLTEKVVDWAKKLAGARSAVQELADADAGLRQALADAQAERAKLINLRAPKSEVLRALDDEITTLADRWAAEYGMRLVTCLAGTVDVAPSGEPRGIVRYATLTDEVGGLGLPALAALLPIELRAGLAEVIAKTSYEEGPAMAERVARVATVDRKIRDLEQQHSQLCDDARVLGITLALLPEENARRIQAAAQRRESVDTNNRLNRDAIERGVAEPLR
jgi:hypothetical protein